jgi:hypothetical protein
MFVCLQDFSRISVVVYNFHVVRVLNIPDEADAVLVVNPDTVLAGSISLQRFKPISWQGRKI